METERSTQYAQAASAIPQGRSELPRISCSRCGGNIPVVCETDTTCPYCSADVDVPEDVKRRYREHALVVADMQAQGMSAVSSLDTSLDPLTIFVGSLMTAWIVVTVSWFAYTVSRHGPYPSGQDAVLICSLLLGPLTFYLIRRESVISEQLVDASKLEIARVVPQPDKVGTLHLAVACSACGALFENAYVHGLTIRCNHCDTRSLTPSVLVHASERKYFQRLMSTRDATEKTILRGLWAPSIVGILFFISLCVGVYGAPLDTKAFYPSRVAAIQLVNLVLALYFVCAYEAGVLARIYLFLAFVIGPTIGTVCYMLAVLN